MLDKEKNFKSRLEFVRFWADYVRKTPNSVWSRQQADFIDALFQGANQDVGLYLRVKKMAQGNAQVRA
ncbi:MAG TPA: hypothetical protein VI979_03095 [archaeon]|nr:hypothetical protein [archaeon]